MLQLLTIENNSYNTQSTNIALFSNICIATAHTSKQNAMQVDSHSSNFTLEAYHPLSFKKTPLNLLLKIALHICEIYHFHVSLYS